MGSNPTPSATGRLTTPDAFLLSCYSSLTLKVSQRVSRGADMVPSAAVMRRRDRTLVMQADRTGRTVSLPGLLPGCRAWALPG